MLMKENICEKSIYLSLKYVLFSFTQILLFMINFPFTQNLDNRELKFLPIST